MTDKSASPAKSVPGTSWFTLSGAATLGCICIYAVKMINDQIGTKDNCFTKKYKQAMVIMYTIGLILLCTSLFLIFWNVSYGPTTPPGSSLSRGALGMLLVIFTFGVLTILMFAKLQSSIPTACYSSSKKIWKSMIGLYTCGWVFAILSAMLLFYYGTHDCQSFMGQSDIPMWYFSIVVLVAASLMVGFTVAIRDEINKHEDECKKTADEQSNPGESPPTYSKKEANLKLLYVIMILGSCIIGVSGLYLIYTICLKVQCGKIAAAIGGGMVGGKGGGGGGPPKTPPGAAKPVKLPAANEAAAKGAAMQKKKSGFLKASS